MALPLQIQVRPGNAPLASHWRNNHFSLPCCPIPHCGNSAQFHTSTIGPSVGFLLSNIGACSLQVAGAMFLLCVPKLMAATLGSSVDGAVMKCFATCMPRWSLSCATSLGSCSAVAPSCCCPVKMHQCLGFPFLSPFFFFLPHCGSLFLPQHSCLLSECSCGVTVWH